MSTGDRMAAHAEAVIDVASRSVKQALGGFDGPISCLRSR
jgi:hypothetical protein